MAITKRMVLSLYYPRETINLIDLDFPYSGDFTATGLLTQSNFSMEDDTDVSAPVAETSTYTTTPNIEHLLSFTSQPHNYKANSLDFGDRPVYPIFLELLDDISSYSIDCVFYYFEQVSRKIIVERIHHFIPDACLQAVLEAALRAVSVSEAAPDAALRAVLKAALHAVPQATKTVTETSFKTVPETALRAMLEASLRAVPEDALRAVSKDVLRTVLVDARRKVLPSQINSIHQWCTLDYLEHRGTTRGKWFWGTAEKFYAKKAILEEAIRSHGL
jgi:hypothetical protein